MTDFSSSINSLIKDNEYTAEGQRIRYKRQFFRSKLELEWYNKLNELYFPRQKVLYEPVRAFRHYLKMPTPVPLGKYEPRYSTYKPDFAIMPRHWKRPVSMVDFAYEVGEKAVFIEVKPESSNNIVENQIQLVENHIVMLYGYPDKSPGIFLVKTFGGNQRELWETIKFDDVKSAVHASVIDRNPDDKRFLRMSDFTHRRKKDELRT